MITYTFSQARQQFASVLEKAKTEGKVLITRKDGSTFILKPVKRSASPLNIKGVDISLSAKEIVSVLREVRDRS